MKKFDPYSYFFELPLYTKISVSQEEFDEFLNIVNFDGKIHAYNPSLKENTTYTFKPSPKREGWLSLEYYGGIVTHTIKCVRTGQDFYVFSNFDAPTKILQKVGQYLSIADFHISQIKQYDKVLPNEQLKEFTRAIGLAANGVGIGSFVYLRRIFEILLEEVKVGIELILDEKLEEFSKAKKIQDATKKISTLNSKLK